MEKKPLLSIEELFKKSFSVYKEKAFVMMELNLITYLASFIIALIIGAGAFLFFWKSQGFNIFGLLLVLIAVLLIVIVQAWIQAALVYTAKTQEKLGFKTILTNVKDKIASYFWVIFLRGLITMLGFIAFIIPGILFTVWFSFAQYAFMVDSQIGMQALKRSRELTKGYWWAILGRLLIIGIIIALVGSIKNVGLIINCLFVVPFAIVYSYTLYENLKSVKGSN